MSTPSRGTLVTWKHDKAFGFIRPDEGGKDVFVHTRDFGNIGRSPQVGDIVLYQPISDGKGRFRAADVQVEGSSRSPATATARRALATRPSRARYDSHRQELRAPAWAWIVVATFSCALAGLIAFTQLPVVASVVYVIASLLAFLLYAFDKAAAMNKRWRTKESTLLLVGLLGGWPGALIAQGMFRHKSSKAAFLVPFWISVALNCAGLFYATTAAGSAAIRGLLY
jgi:uncharacterized membrane protein YsdA (DUF1294 family)/cold shock CspA family protein